MTRLATTPGLFPLPDSAKTELIDLKGKQKEDLIDGNEGAEIRAVYDRARRDVIDMQTTSGLDRIVEGQLRWDDMLCHPLVVNESVQTGGLVRYYDNNNFYREPVVQETLHPTGDIGSELEAAIEELSTDSLQGVIPGPYSLSQLAAHDTFDSAQAFLEGLAEFLAGEIERFPALKTLFILEPSLAVEPPSRSEGVMQALRTVSRAADGIEDVIVHTYWGVPPSHVYTELLDVPGVGIGLDCVTDPDEARERVQTEGAPQTIALGVVDGQNTRLESLDEIESILDSFGDATTGVERTYLTTNTELFYLPVNRVADKLGILGRAADPAEVSP